MSYLLKLARAEAHLQELNESVERWREANPEPWAMGPLNPKTLEYVYKLRFEVPFDESWPAMLGDFLFNARAALEYMVFEMSLNAPIPPKGDQFRNIGFPIYGDRTLTRKRATETIGFISAHARIVIETLQPHRQPNFLEDPLWHLDVLNNIDKHRALHIVGAGVDNLTASGHGGVTVESFTTPPKFLENGDELTRVRLRAQGPKDNPHFTLDFDMEPCVKDAPILFPISQGATRILSYIKKVVIPALRPYM